jgi:hypothetical protein
MPSQVREALTALGASPFVQKVIDPVLVELQRRYAPLVRSIPTQRWTTDVYNFNQRTAVPGGGFVPDGGARPVANSSYVQNSYQMKHVQSVGSVTGYAQAVANLIDLRRTEIMGAGQGYYWDIECGMIWGRADATLNQAQPQFDGLDSLVSDYTSAYANVIDYNNGNLTTGTLDNLADLVQKNAKMPIFNADWMYIMSTTAKSKIAQILIGQQRYQQVQIAAGLIVDTYRNIPMVESSFLSSYGFSMGTVTPTTATTGGTLAAGTWRYQIAPVIARQGVTVPSAEATQVTTGATSTVTLSFTPPTGYDGLAAQLYKVYRTALNGATGTETFLGYADATVGLQSDGVTPIPATSIIDTGSALVPQGTGNVVPATLPTAYFGTNTSMKPPATGQEEIFLISRNRNNVVRPYVREAVPLDVYPTTSSPDTLPYALIGDTALAVRASRFVGRASRVLVALSL